MRAVVLTSLLLAVVVVAPAEARGQDAASAETRARALSQQGMRAYAVGRYDRAIEMLEQAYALHPVPGFLFNLAQAYRKKGDCERSYHLYDRYLSLAKKVRHRSAIAALRAEMDACRRSSAAERTRDQATERELAAAERERAAAERERVALARARDAPPGVADESEGRPGRRNWIGIGALSAGVAFAGAGAVFALDARAAEGDVNDAFESGGVWTEELASTERRGKRSGALAGVFAAVGAAGVATGAVLLILGDRGEPAPSVAVHAHPAGAGVTWTVDF